MVPVEMIREEGPFLRLKLDYFFENMQVTCLKAVCMPLSSLGG